ncbi:hypothetical protein NMY22_g6539 [Coprinellus aureogranulatus]|nr:hypothetical protein NMY22_g6539 [Coprinellus aureogranulatus]
MPLLASKKTAAVCGSLYLGKLIDLKERRLASQSLISKRMLWHTADFFQNDPNTPPSKATLSPTRSISAQEVRCLPPPLQCGTLISHTDELDSIIILVFDSRDPDAAPGDLGKGSESIRFKLPEFRRDPRQSIHWRIRIVLERRSRRKRMSRRVQGYLVDSYVARVRTCGLPAGKRCDMAPEFCAIDRSMNPDLISYWHDLRVPFIPTPTSMNPSVRWLLSFCSRLYHSPRFSGRAESANVKSPEPLERSPRGRSLVTKLIRRRGDWYWKWVNGIHLTVRAHPALQPTAPQYKLGSPTFSILPSTASHPDAQTLQIGIVALHPTWSVPGLSSVSMASSSLVVSRLHRLHPFSADRNIRNLSIDGAVLQDELSSASAFQATVRSSASLTSLTIGGLGECAWRMTDNILPYFFQFLQSLPRLRHLTINDFVLQVPNSPPPIPPCVAESPVSVRKLTVTNCHSTSLSFLLDCLEPSELTLEACWFIESLPMCDRLELCDVQPFEGLMERLLEWDGDELTIDSCPFISEGVISRLIHRMEETENAVWPGARLSFEGYPYAVRRGINEMLDIRSRM